LRDTILESLLRGVMAQWRDWGALLRIQRRQLQRCSRPLVHGVNLRLTPRSNALSIHAQSQAHANVRQPEAKLCNEWKFRRQFVGRSERTWLDYSRSRFTALFLHSYVSA
jgi:hypothetical protein